MATDRSASISIAQPGVVSVATPVVVDRVVEMTRQLFSGSVSLDTSRDPEFPQDEFLVLTVEPAGEIDDLLSRERQWIRRLAAIVPGLGAFRLAIHPKNP